MVWLANKDLNMPKVYTTLSNVDQTIVRPTIYSILGQIQDITKLKKDTLVLFPGDSGINPTTGSAMEEDKNREARFNTTNMVQIEVDYDHDVDDLSSTDSYGRYTYPIFKDDKLGVQISPIYSTVNVTINFKYTTPSKTEALRWRDDLRTRLSQKRDINLHKIDYSYSFPLMYLLVLRLIHDRREAIAGYGDTIAEYVKTHSTRALTVVSDSSGNDTSLTIAETQARIIGTYDFSPLPEKPERDSDNGVWTISFSYKFSFDKPIAATMKYPLLVHNQALPEEYVDFNEDELNLNRQPLIADGRVASLNYFEYDSAYNRIIPDKLFIRIPEFDDYQIDQMTKGTGTVFLALCQLDPEDPKMLLNLNELGDIVIDNDIMEFIKAEEWRYMLKPFYSILNVSLYKNKSLMDHEAIVCDSDLNLRLASDPNFRNEYRIRFSILCDLSLLSFDAVERLKKYPKAFKKIVASTNEVLAAHPDFNKLADKNRVTEFEYSTVYRLLTGQGVHSATPTGRVSYYGPGLPGSSIPGRYTLFKDLDPKLIKYYIDNTIRMATVQVSSVLALRRDLG